ncbi:MAG: Intermediate filament protein [Alyxoria varia]|nr:MAG: Intermediate filament protein [Alyxoria varia]
MPITAFQSPERYQYRGGLHTYHETETIAGALPIGQNSPQKPPFGLYNEKLSGTAFTAPRSENQQSWLYRILPASAHEPFQSRESSTYNTNPENKPYEKINHVPNQIRWDPFDMDETVDWVHSLHLVAGAGDPTMKQGVGIFIFAAGRDMVPNEAFYSADGDFLIVPQHGVLDIQTEFGKILVRPNEICVVPRGIRYRVTLPDGPVRGYVLELYQGHFQLPELGPIGSNGLANARDFQVPVAAFDEDTDSTWYVLAKFGGHLFAAKQSHTPFDIVAWHGTYFPYKYDLGRFSTIGSISFDHPDPSIYTVLSAQSDHAGTAIADFLIFPPRWLVQEDTFRPPWYHRNTMSEFMGLIQGSYDAKAAGAGGFQPAGASLHSCMSGHGPDAATHEKASHAELRPSKAGEGSMAFMFESCLMVGVTDWGLKRCQKVQEGYNKESWIGLKPRFRRPGEVKGQGANNAPGEIADGTQLSQSASDAEVHGSMFMALGSRNVVLSCLAALVAWVFASSWLPSTRFLPYAFFAGFATAIAATLFLSLLYTRPIVHDDTKIRFPATSSLSFTESKAWKTETDALKDRGHYRRQKIRGIPSPVSRSLDSILRLIIRDFVESWFSRLSNGTTFPNEIDRAVRYALSIVSTRLASLNVVDVGIKRILPAISAHLEHFVEAERVVRGKDIPKNVTETEELNVAVAAKYDNGKLHPAASLAASKTSAPQQKHLRSLVEKLLPRLLPPNMATSPSVMVLVKEIIACAVILPIMKLLSDPDFLNQQIEAYGHAVIHERKTVRKLRAALDQHASPRSKRPKSNSMLPRLRPDASEREFEKMIRAIRKCENLSDARRFRSELVRQMERDKRSNSRNGTYFKRLEVGRKLLDQRTEQLSGASSRLAPSHDRTSTSSSSHHSNPETASLRDVLYDAAGLSFFMEYMDRKNLTSFVQYWMVVDGYRNPLEQEGEDLAQSNRLWSESERQDLARICETYQKDPNIVFPHDADNNIQDFLDADEDASTRQFELARQAILDAQSRIFNEMQDYHFASFKQSDMFYKWVATKGISRGVKKPPLGIAPKRTKSSKSSDPIQEPTTNLLKEPSLRRAIASSSDLHSDNRRSEPSSETRRSLDDNVARPPLFGNDDLGPSNDADDQASIEAFPRGETDKQAITAVQAALDNIVDEKPSGLFSENPRIGPGLSDIESDAGSVDMSTSQELRPGLSKRPSLKSLGLVGAASSRTVFTHDDLFGENEKLWEDENVHSEGEARAEDQIQEASPGDLGLSEVIQALSLEIDKLEAQLSVVNSLTDKAELINNAAELRILRKSKVGLEKDIHRKQLQKQQYIVQENDNMLFGKATVQIKSIMVSTESDGHEFALYVIEVQRRGDDNIPAATWAITRRYSEFYELHRRLRKRFSFVQGIDFPRRQVVLTLQKDFLKKRRSALEKYLQELLKSPAVCRSLELRAFLSQHAIQPLNSGDHGVIDRRDFVTRIYNSVTDGMEEFLGNVPVLDQLSLAGQNLISAATSASTETVEGGGQDTKALLNNTGNLTFMPGAVSEDPTIAAEAQAEISALENHPNLDSGDPLTAGRKYSRPASFIGPIAAAFSTLFQLKSGNSWLRGRAVVVVLQQILGGTVERRVRETFRSLFLVPDALARHLDMVREIMWPDGVLRPAPDVRTAREKERSKMEAGEVLSAMLEEAAGGVVGRSTAKEAGKRINRMLCNERLNAHLVFSLLDEIVETVFEVKRPSTITADFKVMAVAAKDHHRWWKEGVIYQVYPASFCDGNGDGWGDVPGITSKLDHIKELGADIVWISPIYKSPQVDMGYDIADYKDIDPKYGTLADVDHMIAEIKKRDMRLWMDLVVNHTSDQHEWFKQSRSSRDNPKRSWYIWKDAKYDSSGNRQPPNNWSMILGEESSAWTWDEPTQQYYLALFTPEQPDLNWENTDVRAAVHDVMLFWLEKGCSGFRMDVINHISKVQSFPDAPVADPSNKYQPGSKYFANGPRLHEFLKEINDKVLEPKGAGTVGEMPFVDDEKEILKCVAAGRKELNMIFIFDLVSIDNLHFRMTLREWQPREIGEIVSRWQKFMIENDGWNSVFLENHDNPRSVSRYCDGGDKHRMKGAKLLALMASTLSGTLFVYQGQEIGMRNCPKEWGVEEFKDVETQNFWRKTLNAHPNDPSAQSHAREIIHRKARDHARTPMHWDSSAHAGFSLPSKGDAAPAKDPWMRVMPDYTSVNAALQKDKGANENGRMSVFAFWRRAIRNRRAHKESFVYGAFYNLSSEGQESSPVFAYLRAPNPAYVGGLSDDDRKQAGVWVVVLNFSGSEVAWDVPKSAGEGNGKVEFEVKDWVAGSYDGEVEEGGRGEKCTEGTVKLRAWEGLLGRCV